MKSKTLTVRTSPSLALIKYWGKTDSNENLPATSSLALTLDGLFTETKITISEKDSVLIDGVEGPLERFTPFFNNIRTKLNTTLRFSAESSSNFPASAGLASSSSGFAALAYGCAKLADPTVNEKTISECARLGSASAARALFGGFTVLPKDSPYAENIFDKDHWPELRVIIAIVKNGPKSISSRNAMESAKRTSPYYKEWILGSEKIFQDALKACQSRNLEQLGPLIRKSYLMMFSTMFTSTPPVFYWEPESIALIKACEELRHKGLGTWETMDAGPQVKIVCLDREAPAILEKLQQLTPHLQFILSRPGNGPQCLTS